MKLALPLAVALLMSAAAPALAQFGGQAPPCMNEFVPLRDDAQKKAEAIKAASERHAPAIEACKLFKSFSAAEAKVIKYATDNSTWCGIPPQMLTQMKANHSQTVMMEGRICKAAAMGGGAPAGPSLSDALGSSNLPDTQNIKRGRGTFDTLTGTPLGSER
ncbi:MAG TPA: hypothetical protein VFB45_24550 [Pseudolabrys sp.]|nr:hypothetical protein [Pseudolabrys sp.]